MTKFNRTIGVAAAVLCVAGAAAPVLAQTQDRMVGTGQLDVAKESRAARPRASQASQDPNRRICVRADLSGSRISRHICRTRAEWDRVGGLPDD